MKSLYNLFTTKGQLIALVLALVVIAISVLGIFGGLSSGGYDVGTDLNAVLKGGGGNGFNFFNSAILLPGILIGIATFLWIGFTVFQVLTDIKGSSKIVIAFLIIAVMFFVFKAMNDSETTGKLAALIQKNGISEGVSTSISGGIWTTLVLTILAAVLMIVMEVLNMFK